MKLAVLLCACAMPAALIGIGIAITLAGMSLIVWGQPWWWSLIGIGLAACGWIVIGFGGARPPGQAKK
jgi:hypothetical protein